MDWTVVGYAAGAASASFVVGVGATCAALRKGLWPSHLVAPEPKKPYVAPELTPLGTAGVAPIVQLAAGELGVFRDVANAVREHTKAEVDHFIILSQHLESLTEAFSKHDAKVADGLVELRSVHSNQLLAAAWQAGRDNRPPPALT